jgi:site-specific DNA-methyltransferase (adenine-specific)
MTGPLVSRARAAALPWRDGVARACVTSPPYWGLRTYGPHADELGTEDLHVYLSRLVEVFGEVRRVLRPDGLAWVNIADTAAGSGGAGGDYGPAGRRSGYLGYRQARPTIWRKTRTYGEIELSSLAAGQWCNVPGRLVGALQEDGWRLRAWITWAKTTTAGRPLVRPENMAHANRPGVSSEVILLLAPGPGRSLFDPTALVEAGDVWHFPPVRGAAGGGHPAPFPDELARRCILPSTRRGDLVVDPFHGSGTTGRVAGRLGRRYAGADLYATTTSTAEPRPPALAGQLGLFDAA